jgi:hypothetical protein
MPDATLPRPKRVNEEFGISWDFVNDMAAADTVATISITAKQVDTGADVTGTFLQGATFSGKVLSVQVQGGTAGKDYDVTFRNNTTGGDVFERVVRVQVRA